MTDLSEKLDMILRGDYFPRLGFVEPVLYGSDAKANAVSEDAAFADAAMSGLDIFIGAKYDLSENKAAVIKTLKMCEKTGLLYLIHDRESFRKDRSEKEARKYFEKTYAPFRKFKSFAGVSPVDEPGYASWHKLKKFRRAFNAVFPDKLYYVNLLQNYAPSWAIANGACKDDDLPSDDDYGFYCKSYVKQADPAVFCYDFYPFREEYPKVKSEYFPQLETALKYADEKDIPIWCFLQSASFPEMSGFARTPTFEEMLWQANTSLCYGTKGLAYFCYWMPYDDENWTNSFVDVCGNKTETFYKAKKLNEYLLSIGKYFLKSKVCKVFRGGKTFELSPFSEVEKADGNAIIGCMKSGEEKHIFCVNGSFTEETEVSLELSSGVKSVVSLFDGVRFQTEKGKLTFRLGKGEGKLFAI